MMAVAVPRKNEYGAIEGLPSLQRGLVQNSSEVSLPPPPPTPKSLFDLDLWLESNKISHLKEVFISHKMTTYDSINTSNSNFALLIASPLIIESSIVSDVVIAIQTLHSTPHDNDNDNKNTQYIIVSNDEHKVLTELKQCLFEINKTNIELNGIEQKYIKNKKKIQHNKTKYIEKCKDKINLTFLNLTQIINKRQQVLLKKVDEIHLNQVNDNKDNKIMRIHLNDIRNEINDHEQYINDQINEYKSLIHTTKTNYETKTAKTRRDSIIKLGNDTHNSHEMHSKYILGKCEKIKEINDDLIEGNIEFVVDDDYLNKFLIYMKHSFGYILNNISKPNISNIYFNCDNLIIQIKGYNNIKYEIIRYELAYFVEYDDEEKDSILVNDDTSKSNSSGSSLFSDHSHHIHTEGAQNDTKHSVNDNDTKHNDDDVLWRLMEIQGNNDKIEIKIRDIDCNLKLKSGDLIVKMRRLLIDNETKSKFWSLFSDDFNIKLKNILYIAYDDDIVDEEKKECFELVSDPTEKESDENRIETIDETRDEVNIDHETPTFSINPLSGITPNILKENDEENDIWSSFPPKQEMEFELKRKKKKKKKKKKRKQKSWGHSLNLKLTGLFSSNTNTENGDDDDDDIFPPVYSPSPSNIKPFAKRSGHIKSHSMQWSHSMPLDQIHQNTKKQSKEKDKHNFHNNKKKRKHKKRTQSMVLNNIDNRDKLHTFK